MGKNLKVMLDEVSPPSSDDEGRSMKRINLLERARLAKKKR